jgi:hypothetical protein
MKQRLFCTILIFIFIFSILSANFIPASKITSDIQLIDGADIPTWYEGDEWIYTADPVSFSGDQGSFSGVIQNFKRKVLGIIEITQDEREFDVYEVEISGTLSGEFSFEELSGDIVGEISGLSYIRVSDLAEVKTDICSTGIATILFIDRDYEMAQTGSFFPPLEVYDFPIKVDEQWYISTFSESSGWFILEDLMDENFSEAYWLNATVECIAKENVDVPAGTFESYNINYGSNSLWYAPDVGNMVKSIVDETTENSTFEAVISLESFTRNIQPLDVTEEIDPQEAFIYSDVIISGQVTDSETGDPIDNGNVFIEIPAIGDGWNTNTDELGNYMITIDVPLIIDDTPGSDEFGSVGVVVECRYANLFGYQVKTLVIIDDFPPENPQITGSTEGDVGTSYTYTFISTDIEGHKLTYIIDWGDGSSTETVGPVEPGVETTATHTWSKGGTFEISAKAKDEIGAESGVSTIRVKMPRNRVLENLLLKTIFNNHRVFQILKDIFLK